jgi:hypothetical protein
VRQELREGAEQAGVSAVGEEGRVVVQAVDHPGVDFMKLFFSAQKSFRTDLIPDLLTN